MRTEVLAADDPTALERALDLLRTGRALSFPTDTVYGLGALAFDPKAVGRLYRIKGRREDKAIPVLLADADALLQVALQASPTAMALAARFWPGPLTLVVPRHPDLPSQVSQGATVAVRVPDHPVALALLRAAGPLAVTSANRSGQPSPSTAREVLDQLDGRIRLILDGGRTPGGIPSTVVNCTGAQVTILRQGPIRAEQVRQVTGDQPGNRTK